MLREKLKESIQSILPVSIIMIIVGLLLNFNIITIISIIISTLFLILGVTIFTYGADLSMIEIGKLISSDLVKTKKPILIALISLIVGIIITIAEPDLKVLALQMTAIDSNTFIFCVGLGVGLFLSLAALRILFQANLKIILAIFYSLLIFMLFISNKEIIPIAFDSGGVTTGPISVPFIIAMGLGFSSSRNKKESKDDSFGLVALCSIGPIIIVLLFNMLTSSDMNYIYNIEPEITKLSTLFLNYKHELLPVIKDVFFSLSPILGLFIIYNLTTRKIKKKKLIRIIFGLILTLIGITIFFLGVNVGYMPIAYLIGINMTKKFKYLLIPLGIIIGFVTVKAEPAISILTEQIEKITQGSMKKNIITNTIAIGVACAVSISIYRVLSGTSINNFLIIGYIIALLLMIITPNLFTMIAFDSGGAVSGPLTTTFLLPLVTGICYQVNGNVLTDAFGLVALVALSPLITIQILGVIYNLKTKPKDKNISIDETIISYNWRDQNE